MVPYLLSLKLNLTVDDAVHRLRSASEARRADLKHALVMGARFKAGDLTVAKKEFLAFLKTNIARRLKAHQIKAAIHLLTVGNGANFSVPGSGKTSVVLSVFHWLRNRGELDALFVVGPPSCFAPWKNEYKAVIGETPSCEILAGGAIDERNAKYFVGKTDFPDLYLTSFQTLLNDWEKVRFLLSQPEHKFALVVDEAHYIKQLGGSWANAVLNIAKSAKARWILTGTPFPCSYVDAFNAFDVLWPDSPPIAQRDRLRIQQSIQAKDPEGAARVLDSSIGPLFYRVRKADLKLAPQRFHDPVLVAMKPHERFIYNAILARVKSVAEKDFALDYDIMLRLKRGRIMRLRQCISYARLVGAALTDYDERLAGGNSSLLNTIRKYDELETPAKLDALVKIVISLRRAHEKVVVWSNFVETLKLIRDRLRRLGLGVHLIYGATPTEHSNAGEEITREQIIAEFLDPSAGIDVLVANPAACAESISLHKTCSHAVYYDLSYNCAQFLQSTDRIHRVGGSENKPAHYHFLQYADTIDADIAINISTKARNMTAIIDRDYPIYSLDMFSDDEEVEAYDRLFSAERHPI